MSERKKKSIAKARNEENTKEAGKFIQKEICNKKAGSTLKRSIRLLTTTGSITVSSLTHWGETAANLSFPCLLFEAGEP